MPTVNRGGVFPTAIHFEAVGGGRPVVLIHGWPLSHRMWESQVNALTANGYRCIAYDRRGFGDSGRPSGGYDYDTFADDLQALMLHLDLRDATLIVLSMGGGEVARYLLETDDNPEGVDGKAFDATIATVRSNRIALLDRFFIDFYNAAPGNPLVGRHRIAFS